MKKVMPITTGIIIGLSAKAMNLELTDWMFWFWTIGMCCYIMLYDTLRNIKFTTDK